MGAELRRLAHPVDADHQRKAAGPAGLDAGQRVLEHRRRWLAWHAQFLRRGEEGVRRGLSA